MLTVLVLWGAWHMMGAACHGSGIDSGQQSIRSRHARSAFTNIRSTSLPFSPQQVYDDALHGNELLKNQAGTNLGLLFPKSQYITTWYFRNIRVLGTNVRNLHVC